MGVATPSTPEDALHEGQPTHVSRPYRGMVGDYVAGDNFAPTNVVGPDTGSLAAVPAAGVASDNALLYKKIEKLQY